MLQKERFANLIFNIVKIAIISDIHEDAQNLREAFRLIKKRGCDKVVCLGDISGFSIPYYTHQKERNAHECLQLLKESCDHIIVGNHDMHAAKMIPKLSPFFSFPENWHQLDYREKIKACNGQVWLHEENDLDPLYSQKDIEFLQKLPQYHIMESSIGNILFSHYAYPNISGMQKEFFTYPDQFEQHFAFMKQHKCKIGFMGHSHAKKGLYVAKDQYKRFKNKKLKIDSPHICIGCPPIARYGNKSRFCIFDTDTLLISLIRF
jgi:predicted phosphodiesterase